MHFENGIVTLCVDEYLFLTDTFEIADTQEVQEGINYIVLSRKKNILKTVKKVIQNEFDDLEKSIALEYWGEGLSIDQIMEKHNISRSKAYRVINNTKDKLEKFIKYVLVYNEFSTKHSATDFLEYIKGEHIEN